MSDGPNITTLAPAEDELSRQNAIYVTALMEVKSSMGVIVAAPTAGSRATFPATCVAAASLLTGFSQAGRRNLLPLV